MIYDDNVGALAFSEDPAKIPELLDNAKDSDPPETVIVLTTAEIDTTDPAVFAAKIKTMDDGFARNPDLAGWVVFVDTPLCRVMQQPLQPTDHAPTGLVLTGTTADAKRDCYWQAIAVHVRRSLGWDLDGEGHKIAAVDATADRAQQMMPVAASMGWMLADAADPDRNTRRANAVFAPGEEIIIRTTLDYIRKRGAGYPGAAFEIELDIEIRGADGALVERLEDVYRYTGEVRHRVPVDADYFRNWIVGSVRLQEQGAYRLVFLLTDRMAPEDKQIPVAIEVDVTVE